jgi:cardiolipin synthase
MPTLVTVLWGLGLLLALLIGVMLAHLYLQGHFRPMQSRHLKGLPTSSPHFLATIASLSDSLTTDGKVTQFWSDIDAIQAARLQLIEQAEQLIQFETFIMTPGQRADQFAAALRQKASVGVRVQILADSYGAKKLPESYWRQLCNAGVEVRFFNPFSARAPLDYLRRNHRKLLVVDQKVAMIGGAGISDLWDGKDGNGVPWYDFEVEWQGAVVGMLTGFFWQHWLDAGGAVDLSAHHPDVSQVAESRSVLITPGEDPSVQDSPIRSLLHLCITSAQSRLWIASPYLLPDPFTCQLLTATHQRGVDVRIITMGPNSDKPYVYYVSRERYGPLLRQGIQLYEYQPSMMHAKLLLIDQDWVSLGSANLDPRSFFHNDELNLCSGSERLIQNVERFFEQGFHDSILVARKRWGKRPLQEKLAGRIGNLFYWQM